MAFWEDAFEGSFGTSLGVGIGVALVGPILVPVVGGMLRPVAKAAIKGGLMLAEAGREGAERLNEMSGDVMAEARSEFEATRREKGGTRERASTGAQAGGPAHAGSKP